MNAQKYRTTVGAFVLGGISLLALGFIVLGGGRLFSNDMQYVLYFDGSVSGLSTGAPVVFRGVPMGSVTRINLVANTKDSNVTIPVYIRIDEQSFVRARGSAPISESVGEEIVRRMVQRGLRARLQLQSLITGQYRIELDFFPGTPAVFRSGTPDTEIPTIPSPIDTLQTTLAQLPLESMAHALEAILQSLAHSLADDSLGRGLKAFTRTFEEVEDVLKNSSMRQNAESILKKLNTAASTVEGQMPGTFVTLRAALESMSLAADQLRVVTASAQSLMGRDSPTVNDVRRLIRESIETLRTIRNFTQMLERNPEALLMGRQGKR